MSVENKDQLGNPPEPEARHGAARRTGGYVVETIAVWRWFPKYVKSQFAHVKQTADLVKMEAEMIREMRDNAQTGILSPCPETWEFDAEMNKQGITESQLMQMDKNFRYLMYGLLGSLLYIIYYLVAYADHFFLLVSGIITLLLVLMLYINYGYRLWMIRNRKIGSLGDFLDAVGTQPAEVLPKSVNWFGKKNNTRRV